MRASSNASKPHSYGESFSRVGRWGPSTLPTTSKATPIPPATIRNSRVGRYSASTRCSLGFVLATEPLAAALARRPVAPFARHVVRPCFDKGCCWMLQVWCPRGDSNPHDLRRYHLKVVRLPIPPPGLVKPFAFLTATPPLPAKPPRPTSS